MPGFCCPFGLFRRFCGVFRCLSQLSKDEVKAADTAIWHFERTGPRGCFLAEIRIHCLIFRSSGKKVSPLVPFSGRLGKVFKLSVPIRTIFAWLLELSAFRRTLLLAQLEINISDCSCVTNATYQTGAQSKISVINLHPFPQTVHPSGKS